MQEGLQITMEAQKQLVMVTARYVSLHLQNAMLIECNGCLVHHASQIEHECVMLTGEERIRFCLDKALTLVDWEKVKNDFVQISSAPYFPDKNCIQHLWTNASWLKQLMFVLLSLEHPTDPWVHTGCIFFNLWVSSWHLNMFDGRT